MNTTIAAIATAHGIGSIAIIRLSGEDALNIAKTLSKRDILTPRQATLTTLYDAQNALIDEAILIYFKGPHSFTARILLSFSVMVE